MPETPRELIIVSAGPVTPYERPTQREALRYCRRVADAYDLNLSFGTEEPDDACSSDSGRR